MMSIQMMNIQILKTNNLPLHCVPTCLVAADSFRSLFFSFRNRFLGLLAITSNNGTGNSYLAKLLPACLLPKQVNNDCNRLKC